jgi:hypothetical protein
MAQYRLADQARAEALDGAAQAAAAAGNHAAVVGDDYIRMTVFLAAVLFLVGIGSTFKLPTVRYVLICVGAVLLLLATALILRQPGIPPDNQVSKPTVGPERAGLRLASILAGR